MNNQATINKYSDDILTAKKLPFAVRDFIIAYGGVEKLRCDVWGKHFGEEVVRQKEKGKTVERAQRAANRHCQDILLEMAWRAGFIEMRKWRDNSKKSESKKIKKVYDPEGNQENKKALALEITLLKEKVTEDTMECKNEEQKTAGGSDATVATLTNDDTKEPTKFEFEGQDTSGDKSVIIAAANSSEQASLAPQGCAGHAAGSLMSRIITKREFNPGLWWVTREKGAQSISFSTPQAVVGFFQRLAVSASVKSHEHIPGTLVMATTTAYAIQLPLANPMTLSVQRDAYIAKSVGNDIKDVKAFRPVVPTEGSVSRLNMPTSKPAWPDGPASKQKDECGPCSEHERTATETVCIEKRKKKGVRARIWSRVRKVFRGMFVCGKKNK